MPLSRDEWLDIARKVDWTYRYVSEAEIFPQEMSGTPWLAHDEAWADWSEAYRTSYSEYVQNQSIKELSVLAVREALDKRRVHEHLDPLWLQLVKFHLGVFALGEYIAVPGELRMARFGRDSAWRIMANLGALDEIRHSQIQVLLGHDLLPVDDNFDWTQKAFHTNNWLIIAARHAFDDTALAANAIETAIQLNLVFETGFTNLQFMALAAMADRADHHVFEKALLSIQTDEARHAQIGHPVLRALIRHGGRDYVQHLMDKMWWRSWRVLVATTGTAMDYLTPVEARDRSFKEFVEEWVVEQYTRNLEEFNLELPWFWPMFLDELDYAHHSLQMALYSTRTLLWFDEPSPSEPERAWLRGKYPSWGSTYEPIWDRIEEGWERHGEAASLAYAMPGICNLCQLPTCFVSPNRNTARTMKHDGRMYLFCSEPCRWIFQQQVERFAEHKSVVDRVVTGEAPGDLIELHAWMGHETAASMGRDLRRGFSQWRLERVALAQMPPAHRCGEV
jgi:toluene monooxygenase system protein A